VQKRNFMSKLLQCVKPHKTASSVTQGPRLYLSAQDWPTISLMAKDNQSKMA
jgi:hypothetical protein